jgi:nitroimidazol reductase NimA-like FMN-containing flavoprotein (pyridoxamine 5'-phosphate oxidase superfamily)
VTNVLSVEAIESLLREEVVARVAYVDRQGRPCIAPITYAYDGSALYGYSMLGSKIEDMSTNPDVCIEVDRIRNAAEWWSITLRGTFEQLGGTAAVDAVQRISDRLRTAAYVGAAPAAAERTYVARQGGPGIAYRIAVTERCGRFSSASA